MKKAIDFTKNKALLWLVSRKSSEETSSKGIWIFVSAMIILIVGGILLTGSEEGFGNITKMFVNTTTGTKTPIGEWKQ